MIVTNLNNVDSADAMDLANLIQSNKQLEAAGPLFAVRGNLDRNALLETNGNFLGFGGRGDRIIGTLDGQQKFQLACAQQRRRRRNSPSPHAIRGRLGWILELSALVAAM